MIAVKHLKSHDVLTLLLVLLIAGTMRFGQPGIVEFFHDDAMLSSLAQDMGSERMLPFTGINSSTGIPNPPQSVYLLSLPFAVDSNPALAIYFIMGLNVIGVGLLWWMSFRYFGRITALIAGMAYALNPWAILFSRKIWAQDFHTPFILFGIFLCLYGFYEAKERHETRQPSRILTRHEWAQVWAIPILLFGFQIHFAAWALSPLVIPILVIARKRISTRAIILSFVLSLLIMLPYTIGLWDTYRRHPEQVRPDAVSTLAETEQPYSSQSLQYLGYLATGFGMETWVAPDQQDSMKAAVPPVALWWLIGIFITAGTALLYREPYRKFAPLLLIWAYLPAIALIPQWAGVFPHYFIASIPALMLLAAIGVNWLVSIVPNQPIGRTIILIAFGIVLLTQGIYWRGVLRFVDRTDIHYPGFTIPLRYLQDIETELETYSDVVILSQGMAWDLHHESVVWPVMLRDSAKCVRTLIGDGYAVFPSGQFAALQTPDMPANGIGQLYQNEQAQTFSTRGDVEYTLFHWEVAPEWDDTSIIEVSPVRFENDVILTGYYLDDQVMVLEWQLPAARPGLNYQYSGQFYDENGGKLGQYDTVFWHGRHWCEGDRLLTWVRSGVPEGTTQLRVGLYRLGDALGPAYINASIIETDGTTIGDQAIIELGES